MWRDTREARQRRYEGCLKLCRTLFEPAQALRQSETSQPEERRPEDTDAEERLREKGAAVKDMHPGCLIDINVCDYVLSPALHGYVLWVLREALASGKQRLYFLARDGYLMYRTAVILCRELELDIECRYLCCSRYSIRLPVYHLDHQGALEYICRGGIDVTMRKILNRAGFTENEKKEMFAEINEDLRRRGHKTYGPDDPVAYAELGEIRQSLGQSCRFYQLLDRHSKDAMPALEGYLLQEGLLEDIPMALADSGWVGSMQKVLGQVLDYISEKNGCRNRKTLEGYYWGLYELPDDADPGKYHCYYFSPENHLREKVYFSNCLFECVFSAPHGMTLGYSHEGGFYRPVFGGISERNRRFIRETEERMKAYTLKLAKVLKDRSAGRLNCENDRMAVRKLLRAFMGAPTPEEAERYGQMSFTDDVLEKRGKKLAEPMTEKELSDNHMFRKAMAMIGARRGSIKESAWYEGSAVSSGSHVGRHLRRYAGYKYLLYLRKRRVWRKNHG